MHSVGMRPVVVHGGGPQIGDADGAARQGARVPRRPAGHRRRDARHRPHGARRQGQPRHRRRPSTCTARSPSACRARTPASSLASARDPELGFVGDVERGQPGDPRAAAGRGPDPGGRRPSAPTSPGQAYNINADTVAGAIAEALGAEKVVYLTDVEGLLARRRRSRQRSISRDRRADELQALIDDGALDRRDDPEDRGLRRTPSSSGVGRAHILDGRVPHVAAARAVHRRRHRHDGHRGRSRRDDAAAPRCRPTRRRRSRSCAARAPSCGTTTGKRYLDFLVRPGRHVARPRPPGGRRRHRRAGAHAAARVEPVRHRRSGPRWPRTLDRLHRRAAARCSSATPAPRPTSAPSSWPASSAAAAATSCVSAYGSFHGRTLATLHATGQPPKHEPFQPLPEGFRHVAWDDLDALERAHRPVGRRRAARAGAGRGRREPGDRRVLPGRARGCATSAACCSWSTRCRPASAAPGGGSASSTSACGPTSSRWPRRSATACRSARAGPAPRWPPPSSPATTPRPSAASRSRPRRPGPCSPMMERERRARPRPTRPASG